MPRDGSIGKKTFEQVEALVKKGKSKTEAFAQVASDTGRNTGTVSANYYPVARANGVVMSPAVAVAPRRRPPRALLERERRGRQLEAAPVTSTASPPILVKSVTALADAIKSQKAEVASLRNRLEGVRQAVG